MSGPCYNCPDRKLKCHDTCQRYLEYKDKLDKINSEERQRRDGYFSGFNLIPRHLTPLHRRRKQL